MKKKNSDMGKYFKSDKSREDHRFGVGSSILLGAVGVTPLLGWHGLSVNRNKIKSINWRNDALSEKLKEHMLKKYKLGNIKFRIGTEAFYSPTQKIISTTKYGPPATLGHELGHAVDFKNFPKTKLFMRGVLPLGGLGATVFMASNEKTRPYAYIPAIGGVAPMLYQEGKASRIALKNLKELAVSAKELVQSKKLLRGAFGTYAAAAVLPALGMQYLLNLKKKGK